ncbi:hypothetical protein BH10PSE14_BH10PSE14_00130 [soil metagenome]
MQLRILACCLLLSGCGDPATNAGHQENALGEYVAVSNEDAVKGGEEFVLTPAERKAEVARRVREDREAERFDRWRASVLPTPRHAFPKIGTCYASHIKEIAIHHERISDGRFPDGEPLEKGSYYWDDDWAWEANPIRENGRIAIPFNGYILYSNGLEQPFDQTWPKQEPPPFARSRVGDKVVMCVVELPDHCPPNDFRGVTYRTRNLRTGGVWEQGDSQHMCGGA